MALDFFNLRGWGSRACSDGWPVWGMADAAKAAHCGSAQHHNEQQHENKETRERNQRATPCGLVAADSSASADRAGKADDIARGIAGLNHDRSGKARAVVGLRRDRDAKENP